MLQLLVIGLFCTTPLFADGPSGEEHEPTALKQLRELEQKRLQQQAPVSQQDRPLHFAANGKNLTAAEAKDLIEKLKERLTQQQQILQQRIAQEQNLQQQIQQRQSQVQAAGQQARSPQQLAQLQVIFQKLQREQTVLAQNIQKQTADIQKKQQKVKQLEEYLARLDKTKS